MRKRSKHDQYVDKLYEELSSWDFDTLKKYVKYLHGELDIYGVKDFWEYYFEVKSNSRGRPKAIDQLFRWKRHKRRKRKYKTHGYIYIGDEDKLEQVF